MSKAFTREDDAPERPPARRPVSVLPPGVKNYVTPDGAKRLQAELEELLAGERPQAVSESAENPGRLAAVDERIQRIGECLQSAVVVEPPAVPDDQVRFGAVVVVQEPDGTETTYRIVGIDETDIDRGWVSWLSPIGKALLKGRQGASVRFRFPSGEKELRIQSIRYETADG